MPLLLLLLPVLLLAVGAPHALARSHSAVHIETLADAPAVGEDTGNLVYVRVPSAAAGASAAAQTTSLTAPRCVPCTQRECAPVWILGAQGRD